MKTKEELMGYVVLLKNSVNGYNNQALVEVCKEILKKRLSLDLHGRLDDWRTEDLTAMVAFMETKKLKP